jgi:hypothetical protein
MVQLFVEDGMLNFDDGVDDFEMISLQSGGEMTSHRMKRSGAYAKSSQLQDAGQPAITLIRSTPCCL